MNRFEDISALLQRGRPRELSALVQEELADGTAANDILIKALIPGMSAVGERFKKNEIFVPEVLITARAMNAALNVLKPALAQAGVEPVGTALICTVKGDLHDIGKNLVKMMIEGTGIQVIDLGVDCPPERVVEAVKEYKPDIVCLSALLTTTMVAQKETIDALKAAGLRDTVKIMVGGAPVTQAFADEIGADAYTPDAATAAEWARACFA
ncbi:MAG: corrinoid protein [Clostridiales bacterium]|nr:corrinoid protein [Clostridiales bacterium]